MRELGRGRLLFYVKFDDSLSVINKSEFSIEDENITFKKLNTAKNITYEKVIE